MTLSHRRARWAKIPCLLFRKGESLASVNEQLNHRATDGTADPWGHSIPQGHIDWAERLDSPTSHPKFANRVPLNRQDAAIQDPQAVENGGGPSRIRTCDQRIMSPLL
jgi:hypothetical protein